METNLSKKIAEELGMGSKVYLNSNNKDILAIPDFTSFDENSEFWEKELTELRKNGKNWMEISKWNSNEEFKFMQDFAENHVSDEKLQNELFMILQNSKPFRNFKFLVENNEKYRQKWFAFIAEKHKKYIEKLLETLNR